MNNNLQSSARYYFKHLGEKEYRRCNDEFRLFLGIPGESYKMYFGAPRDYFEDMLTMNVVKVLHAAIYPVADPNVNRMTLYLKLETKGGHTLEYTEYSTTPEEIRGLLRFADVSKISELEGKCIEAHTEKHHVVLGICIDKTLLGLPVRQNKN